MQMSSMVAILYPITLYCFKHFINSEKHVAVALFCSGRLVRTKNMFVYRYTKGVDFSVAVIFRMN